MRRFLSFLGCLLFGAVSSPGQVTAVSLPRAGLVWMVMSTVLNVVLWTWAGTVAAQTSPSEAAAYVSLDKPAAVSRLVVYRSGDDGLPEQALVRINGSYLASLQRSSHAVVCLPPQEIVLQLQAAPTANGQAVSAPVDATVLLGAGENHYIKATQTETHDLALQAMPLAAARPDLLSTQFAVRTRSRYVHARPCSETPAIKGEVQLTNAGMGLVNSREQ